MVDSVVVLPPGFRVLQNNVSVSGAKLKFYYSGTSTPKTVYSDQTLSTSLGTTVYCDSDGYPVTAQGGSTKTLVYTGTASYKIIITDSNDVTIATHDVVKGATSTSSLTESFSSIASAATTDIGAIDANFIDITGNTPIISFGTGANKIRTVRFGGVLTLTYNATSLILPGAANITTAANDIAMLVLDGSGNCTCVNYQRAAFIPSPNAAPDVIIEQQEASGTAGGSTTAGSWVTRTLNTVVRNVNSVASLATNKITLPAGTYYIAFSAPAYDATSFLHKAKIYNTTDTADVIIGSSEGALGSQQTRSVGSGIVTITGAKDFELRHRSNQSEATSGLGLSNGMSVVEVYGRVEIWKVVA